jgi:hypothetical protein
MHTMPREPHSRGGTVGLYHETQQGQELRCWRVRLEVCRLMWWPEWEGTAPDSQTAADLAKHATRRRLGLGPELVLNILAVHEVRS